MTLFMNCCIFIGANMINEFGLKWPMNWMELNVECVYQVWGLSEKEWKFSKWNGISNWKISEVRNVSWAALSVCVMRWGQFIVKCVLYILLNLNQIKSNRIKSVVNQLFSVSCFFLCCVWFPRITWHMNDNHLYFVTLFFLFNCNYITQISKTFYNSTEATHKKKTQSLIVH